MPSNSRTGFVYDNVVSKVGGDYINFDKLVELDNDGWRLVAVIGDIVRSTTHGAPMWAICQKSDDMVKAPKPDVDMDSDTSPVQPRVATSTPDGAAEILAAVKRAKEANAPKPKKKGFKYGGMVKKDK